MATRSTITARLSDGRFATIYCHFDGYPEHNGRILFRHYHTQESIDKLIDLGDLSQLAESTDCPEDHSFGSPEDGFCVAYGRDRGESDTQANYAATADQALSENKYGPQEFDYLWDGQHWHVNGVELSPFMWDEEGSPHA